MLPGGQACVVNVCDVVTFCRFRAVVIDDSEQLVLPLSSSVLVSTVGRKNVATNFQVDGKVDVLQELLTSAGCFVVDKSFKVKDEDWGKFF